MNKQEVLGSRAQMKELALERSMSSITLELAGRKSADTANR